MSYQYFFRTLTANAQETAQKNRKYFFMNVSQNLIMQPSRVCITKLLKSLYSIDHILYHISMYSSSPCPSPLARSTPEATQSPNFYTFKEPRNRFQGINSASLCSLAGRYDYSYSYSIPSPHRQFKNSSTVIYQYTLAYKPL